MIEKLISLEQIDPRLLYGVNNGNIPVIQKHFSKLKIIARGHELKAIGEDSEIIKFEERINVIIKYITKYNSLEKRDLKQLLSVGGDDFISAGKSETDVIVYNTTGKAIVAKNKNQREFSATLEKDDLLFAIGPAGTGKTYIAIALAVKALKNKEIKRIILSRPAVEAGEHLGFLPGDLKEKLDPYLQPLYDALLDMIPAKKLASLFEDGLIQIAPLAFMRGRTLNDAFVILDEAQNATINQLKMFLTRMGENSKFIVTGDITQIDLPDKNNSGLLFSRNVLKNIEGISFIEFSESDILRHKLVRHIVTAYEQNPVTKN